MAEPENIPLFPPGDAPAAAPAYVTVSQVTAGVRAALQSAFRGRVRVLGEISNFKAHSSGHLYFTLKDAASELSCVMWRSDAARLALHPTDGQEVLAGGEIDVFERTGRYQLYVRQLEPRGTGILEGEFRRLFERLQQEGLFDDARKKPLPPHPGHLALLTSPTGAAVRDMLQTLRRRYPCTTVSVVPVPVQGPDAARSIAAMLDRLNQQRAALRIDVIIVGRGGGSLEDLWAFNEEVLARAISRSVIPVVSAVGHEIDITISDLVADLRAPTPTAAVELTVPLRSAVLSELDDLRLRLRGGMRRSLERLAGRLDDLARRESLRQPARLVNQRAQLLDHLQARLDHGLGRRLVATRQRLSEAWITLATVEPRVLFARAGGRLALLRLSAEKAIGGRSRVLERSLDRLQERLAAARPRPAIEVHRHALETLAGRMAFQMTATLHRHQALLEGVAGRLRAVDHGRTLARGYCVTRLSKNGKMVTRAADVQPGDRLTTQTADGSFGSTADARQNLLEYIDR